MLLFSLDIVHHDVFPKSIVSPDVKYVIFKEVDIGNQFPNEQEFKFCDHMLQRILAFKLGFGVVIQRSDNDSDRRCAFMTMTCQRSRKYKTPLQKLKPYDIDSRKCECLFKLCGYLLANNK